jgi:prefoldin subunit 2
MESKKEGGGEDAPPKLTEQEVIASYRRMLKECQDIRRKIAELEQEAQEHRLVMDTLGDIEESRRAYRLVGGVLVERTVGEVLPSVSQNLVGLEQVLVNLRSTLSQVETEAAQWKIKYGIRTEDEVARERGGGGAGAGRQTAGVLA